MFVSWYIPAVCFLFLQRSQPSRGLAGGWGWAWIAVVGLAVAALGGGLGLFLGAVQLLRVCREKSQQAALREIVRVNAYGGYSCQDSPILWKADIRNNMSAVSNEAVWCQSGWYIMFLEAFPLCKGVWRVLKLLPPLMPYTFDGAGTVDWVTENPLLTII